MQFYNRNLTFNTKEDCFIKIGHTKYKFSCKFYVKFFENFLYSVFTKTHLFGFLWSFVNQFYMLFQMTIIQKFHLKLIAFNIFDFIMSGFFYVWSYYLLNYHLFYNYIDCILHP
jgi:hypothetical protein